MSKKNISIFVLIIALFAFNSTLADSVEKIDHDKLLKEGESAIQREDLETAKKNFLLVQKEVGYSEKLLYQLALVYEKEKNFPEAIWCLRKIQKEFGGPQLEKKIVLLAQRAGGKKISATSFWNHYHRFFNNWGIVVWVLFGLSSALLIWNFLKSRRGLDGKRKWIKSLSWAFATFTILLQVHHLFLMPVQAVIMQSTSAYSCPGYSCPSFPDELSTGELVQLKETKDIWVKVETSGDSWWIPKMVIREL